MSVETRAGAAEAVTADGGEVNHQGGDAPATAFARWIDTFVSEKGLDTAHVFTVDTDDIWERHFIPLAVVIEAAKGAGAAEQAQIKQTFVMIDFKNGDVMHFFEFLARGLALAFGCG